MENGGPIVGQQRVEARRANCIIRNPSVLLAEALKGMEKVAEHINEMQRIHEEYGAIFDHLFRQHQKACKQPIDLSPGKIIDSIRQPNPIDYSPICIMAASICYTRIVAPLFDYAAISVGH